ncbi:MAG: nucleotide exchange factor GrpE, partial [Alphaproteobacteria bacterium]|nr:nucleotide exchange factor GrpE [Alphaproteobacteria bacterium]
QDEENEISAEDAAKKAADSIISADAINRAIRKAAEAPEESFEAAKEEVAESGENVNEALEALKADYETKLGEMKDQLLRAVAESENVRRRATRDVEETSKYAVSGFARDMITVGENLFLAVNSISEEARKEDGPLKSLADGVDMTLRELLNAFEKHGIQRIDPMGEKFDHNRHQAVSQVEDPSKEPNTVLHVMQAGYVINDRLLRPAMVVVSKKGAAESKVDTQA